MTPKERLIDFLTRLIPVVTGIAITFTVQGMINRAHDRHSIRSALELVRTELNSNLKDFSLIKDYLQQEQISARYLVDHRDNLKACPADIVKYHQGIVHADVSVALTHDALELLTMSSLFQKISDSPLSMKIIRAYNSCELMETNVNRRFSARDMQTGDVPTWLLNHDPLRYTDASDVDEAIDAIDEFLKKKYTKQILPWKSRIPLKPPRK